MSRTSLAPPFRTAAVVGAGMSGLSAARRLAAAGVDVKLFDKGRGAGGRMSTRRDGPRRFDHGAQYFTVRDARFRSVVSEWERAGCARLWSLRTAVFRGESMELTGSSTRRFVGVPAMNSVIRHLASSLDVTHGVLVREICRTGEGWGLIDRDGGLLARFDAVLVAVPPEQALPFLGDCPETAAQVRGVRSAPCWAVLASFDSPLGLGFDGAHVNDSPLAWVARDSDKPGRSGEAGECWVIHASPAWSRAFLEHDAATVGAELVRVFLNTVGRPLARPATVQAHRWRFARAENPLDLGGFWDATRQIGICGDWCRGSRVEGAFLSGLEVAGRALGGASPGRAAGPGPGGTRQPAEGNEP